MVHIWIIIEISDAYMTRGAMAKTPPRTYSRTNLEALQLLAQTIRAGRLSRRMTAQELAERAGISRSLLQRIEDGDPTCAIGAVFEAAVVAGVPLFDTESDRLQAHRAAAQERLTLLPQRARKPKRMIRDDF